MSNETLSRRTAVEVSFGGVNVTKSIRPYLLGMTYTDNEEDGLQLRLQDRNRLWREKWITPLLRAAVKEAIEDWEPRAAFVDLDFLEDGDGLRPLVTVEILEEE